MTTSFLPTVTKSVFTLKSYDPLLSACFAPAFYARCVVPYLWQICTDLTDLPDRQLLTFRKPHSSSWCVSCPL